eukprot:1684877-Pyramimonas_sp.AAC.1
MARLTMSMGEDGKDEGEDDGKQESNEDESERAYETEFSGYAWICVSLPWWQPAINLFSFDVSGSGE